jgi:hypothetical protein
LAKASTRPVKGIVRGVNGGAGKRSAPAEDSLAAALADMAGEDYQVEPYMLVFETEFEWSSLAMSHDFEQKYVGLVATIIGGAVLLLGLGGILYNLS